MQQRRGTAAQWIAADPVLAAGEIGYETDTNEFRIGDGVNVWSDLSPFKNLEDLGGSLDDYVPVTTKGQINGVAPLNANGQIPIAFLAELIDDAPAALNTLGEISDLLTTVESSVYSSISTHNLLTTNVHGITNTADLAYDADITAHNSDTTDVHGIANTADLATKSYADTAVTTHNLDTTAVHGIENTADLATKAYADGAVSTHQADTTNVHGIADTAVLVTTTGLSTAITDHNDDTTAVHGIANTALLETLSGAQAKADAAQSAATLAAATAADSKIATHNSDTTDVHGIADTAALATKTYADGAVSTAVAALTKSSVGLANVDNTSDANKPVSTAAQTALDLKAPLANPTFTGTVAGITKSMVGLGSVDNTADSAKPVSTAQATAIATAKSEAIADATSQVNALLTGAPAALNTLDELAAALGDDANFASTVTTNLAAKAPLASPTFTGTVTVAAAGVAFTDGTQTKAGVPSITNIPSALAAGAQAIAAGRADQFIPLTGAVVITLPATGYSTGQSIDFYQESSTGAYFATTNGVVGTPGLKFRATHSVATAMKTSAGWLVFGDLSL